MRALPLLLALALPLAACRGSDTPEVDPSGTSTAGEVGASGGMVAEVVGGTVTLHPDGEQMRYAETEFTVPAGSSIRLVFQNTASGAAMRHNVVVLRPSADANAFGLAAAAAAATDYIPADLSDQVVAHTPMSSPGETVEVAFDVPSEPGDYPFLCTFPGHYMTMRGTMRVVAA